ncbi:MAG: pyridoxal phosphate-dependent aminotransferase [Tissierellia bacterium]|nr:pyridoxal phosphate-dependent aminotransferase [Tissierellia bacterium]
MKISNRVQSMEYSAIRKLVPYAEKAKADGKVVYHLNIGAPDTETPHEFLESIKKVEMKTISYPPAKGLDELREAIANYYAKDGLALNKENIAVTYGASEALLISLLMTTDYGDYILTSDPYYTNYDSFMVETGLKLSTFPTNFEDGFRIPDYDILKSSVKEGTKAILICNPANPTGALYSREELERIAKLAVEFDLYIIADEIYREFIYDGNKFTSIMEIEGVEDRVILLDSISKRFSACGARIGAIMSKNEEIMAAAFKLCTARLAVPTIEQIGATALYEMKSDYLKNVNEEYTKRRDLIYDEILKIEGAKTYKSQGAFYSIVELPIDDTDDFARWLLTDFEDDNETVMVAPLSGFYSESERGKSQIRLAFAVSQEKIKRGIELIKLGLEEYKKINK